MGCRFLNFIKAIKSGRPRTDEILTGTWAQFHISDAAWPEFARAMGLDDAAKSAGSVCVVSVYRAAPGHRAELENSLSQAPGSGDTVMGSVVMTHLEGGPWTFCP
jgi:hypothetical protein